MRLFPLLFSLVFFGSTAAFSQKDSLQQQLFFRGAASLRANFFQQNRQKMADLAAFERHLNKIDSAKAARERLVQIAFWQKVVRQKDHERVRKELLEAARGDVRLAAAFDDRAIELIESNAAFLGLRFEKSSKKIGRSRSTKKPFFSKSAPFMTSPTAKKSAKSARATAW